MRDPLYDYTLRLGDDCLVLGQKLSAWCGHAPSLEVDLGLSNLALDLVGQATSWLELAAKEEGKGRNSDALAFHRKPGEFRNCDLVAQDNGDFAQTLARQFFYSNFQLLYLEALSGSSHKGIAEIAAKSARDVAYHVDFTTDWMIRLGDSACLSHKRLVKSLEHMWAFVDDLFVMTEADHALYIRGIAVDRAALRAEYDARITAVLHEAGLTLPRVEKAANDSKRAAERVPEMHFNTRENDVRWGF